MSGHHASTYERGDGKWGAGCALCGWGRKGYKSEGGAVKAATRHDKEATETDARVHQLLYGSAGRRAEARKALGIRPLVEDLALPEG